jgi:hypothetical protein
MDLPLLIRKLKEKSRYAELAWQDERKPEFLDLHIVLKEAAERLCYPPPLMVSEGMDDGILHNYRAVGYIHYGPDAPNR